MKIRLGTILFLAFWILILIAFISSFFIKFPEIYDTSFTSTLDYADAYHRFYYYLGWFRIVTLLSLIASPFLYLLIISPKSKVAI